MKAVADTENQLIPAQELSNGIVQLASQLAGKDDARAEVIAVTEAPWNAEDLEIGQQLGLFQQPEQVQPLCCAARQFKGVCGFQITVGPRGSENTDSGFCHDHLPKKHQ